MRAASIRSISSRLCGAGWHPSKMFSTMPSALATRRKVTNSTFPPFSRFLMDWMLAWLRVAKSSWRRPCAALARRRLFPISSASSKGVARAGIMALIGSPINYFNNSVSYEIRNYHPPPLPEGPILRADGGAADDFLSSCSNKDSKGAPFVSFNNNALEIAQEKPLQNINTF